MTSASTYPSDLSYIKEQDVMLQLRAASAHATSIMHAMLPLNHLLYMCAGRNLLAVTLPH